MVATKLLSSGPQLDGVKRYVIAPGALSVALAFVAQLLFGDEPARFDFLQYFGASGNFTKGLNPYDPETLSLSLSFFDVAPLQIYAPPALVLILSPLSSLPYEIALFTWRCFSIYLFLLVIAALRSPSGQSRLGPFVICSFIPLFQVIVLGQITALPWPAWLDGSRSVIAIRLSRAHC